MPSFSSLHCYIYIQGPSLRLPGPAADGLGRPSVTADPNAPSFNASSGLPQDDEQSTSITTSYDEHSLQLGIGQSRGSLGDTTITGLATKQRQSSRNTFSGNDA